MLSTHSHSAPNLNFENIKDSSPAFRDIKRSTTVFDGNLCYLKKLISDVDLIDDVDNGKSFEQHKLDACDNELFRKMKFEANRLLSFKNKWPCNYINPEDLAEAGFFYLQSEGKVQCPFCGLTVSTWECGDKPLREHMKKNPKCPFLSSIDVGNIPIIENQIHADSPQKHLAKPLLSSSVSYKPKHPRMSDIERRLHSFREWPLKTIQPRELAKCGLYYTGVSDVVTCFFCGGSLGNWEDDDDPWEEHAKHFGHCIFLSLAKSGVKKDSIKTTLNLPISNAKQRLLNSSFDSGNSHQTLIADIYKQACEIFTEALVSEFVSKNKNKVSFKSLSELCEQILKYEKEKSLRAKSPEYTSHKFSSYEKCSSAENLKEVHKKSDTSTVKKENLLLCKICMDREMEVAFQPCGHLLSCQKCSRLLSDCPMCRKPILSKERIYVAW